jgi:hypothetical protein
VAGDHCAVTRRSTRAAFALSAVGVFLVSLDVSVANAILPAIGYAIPLGLGAGLIAIGLVLQALTRRPAGELAAATALNQCSRQLGAALGVAVTVAAIGSAGRAGTDRFHLVSLICAALAGVAAAGASRLAAEPA